VRVDGKAKLDQEKIGLKLRVAVTVTYTRTRGSLLAAQGFDPVDVGHTTDVLSTQVHEVDTPGVTGEHEPPANESPRKPQTCCSAPVVGSLTDGLFQFALAYSAPARVAPLSEAEVFINVP
jgi:hypothetical protein